MVPSPQEVRHDFKNDNLINKDTLGYPEGSR